MSWTRVALVAPALAGCSLIYNPNNLPVPRAIDAPFLDANPCALELTAVAPAAILEGQGVGGSAPALIVLRGNNIANANLKVVLAGKDGAAIKLDPVTDATASGDTTHLAFTVVAPIDGELGKGGATDVSLDLTVTQDAPHDAACQGAAGAMLQGKLVYRALPELASGPATAPLYSQIDLSAAAVFGTGPVHVELNAVSSIKTGALDASAVNAAGGPGAYPLNNTGGPGVGDQGDPAVALGNGGGGGGGGFGTAGVKGDNGANNGGKGGLPYGQPQVLGYDANRASTGGMGGGGLSAIGAKLDGGPGGGGGGALVLSAGGDITTGSIAAKGGKGGKGAGNGLLGGGGGGGGAGGTVVIRSAFGKLTVAGIDVSGGPGGPAGGNAGGGGGGGAGRVRWDAPVDGAPASPAAAPHRGPAFVDVTRVVTTADPTISLVGTPGDEFDLRVLDDRDVPHAGPHAAFNSIGKAAVSPPLSPGYNNVCAKLVGGSESDPPANVCIGIAYLPPAP